MSRKQKKDDISRRTHPISSFRPTSIRRRRGGMVYGFWEIERLPAPGLKGGNIRFPKARHIKEALDGSASHHIEILLQKPF